MDKLLGPKAGYIEILDHLTSERIKEDATSGNTKTYFPLRPSAAGKCTRELAYELMEERGKVTYEKTLREPASDRLLKLGHSIEYHLLRQFQDAFKRSDKDMVVKYKQQVLSFFKLPGAELVEGSIDAVFMSPKFGVLIDVKSKKDKFSVAYKTDWDDTSTKLEENVNVDKFGDSCFYINDLEAFLKGLKDPFWSANFLQLNLYFFDEHKFLRERGIDHAALIYYCKNDSRLREIRFRPSEAVFEQTKKKFLDVHNAVDAHHNPDLVEKDYNLGSIKCAFCPFSKQCWGGEDTLQAFFDTWPKKKWAKNVDRFPAKTSVQLKQLYCDYMEYDNNLQIRQDLEQDIIKIMNSNKIKKIKFNDGKIYELKNLKTGGIRNGPRMVLRRSKN